MDQLCFSFTDCAPVPQGPRLDVPAPVPEGTAVISVSPNPPEDACGAAGYAVIDRVARRIRRWITVTSILFFRAVEHKVRAFVRSSFRMTGVQILHRCAVLRI